MYSPKISKASAPAAKRSHSHFDAGGFENADDGLRHFRADAVAGDQCNFVRLCFRHAFPLSY